MIEIFILSMFLIIINIICCLKDVILVNIVVSIFSFAIGGVIGSNLTLYSITGNLVIDIMFVIFVVFCALINLIVGILKYK